MLTIIKIFTFCTFSTSTLLCENRKYRGSFQNKLVSSTFKWVSRYILLLAKLKWRGRPLSWRPHCEIVPKSSLVVIKNEKISPFAFVKFEIILPLLCSSLALPPLRFSLTLLQISTFRAHSLVVSNLRSETSSRFQSSC